MKAKITVWSHGEESGLVDFILLSGHLPEKAIEQEKKNKAMALSTNMAEDLYMYIKDRLKMYEA